MKESLEHSRVSPKELRKMSQRSRNTLPVPVVVGFGISTPEQAAEVARSADGVVVGSAIVRQVEEHGSSDDVADRVEAFVKPLVDGTKSV